MPVEKSDRKQFPKRPTVFMFQPKEYSIVTEPEDLRAWETYTRKRLGLDPQVDSQRLRTLCWCDYGSGISQPCDTDVLDQVVE